MMQVVGCMQGAFPIVMVASDCQSPAAQDPRSREKQHVSAFRVRSCGDSLSYLDDALPAAMSSLNKLATRGIRSFDDKSLAVIEFFSPVTVIVGHNGSGKTVSLFLSLSLLYA